MQLPIVVFLLIVFHLFIPIQSFGTIFGNKTIECDFDGKKEIRYVMDCNQEVDYQARAFSFKIDVLDKVKLEGSTEKKVLREVGQVLQILKLQNQQLCQRWNACAISREDFNRQSDWLMEVFTSFSMILENVKLSEMDDPALQKEFLREILDWFKDTAEHTKNKRIHKIWDSIKTELDTLKEEVKDKAREGAKEGAAEAIAEFEKRFIHMLEGKLSPPIPNEKIQQEINSLKARVEKERLEKASILVERGTERLEGEKYEKAIIDFEEALKILPDGSEASLSTYFNLGIALDKYPIGDREANLKKAIQSYNTILSSYEKDKDPVIYAHTQNNLGVAYADLSEVRDKETNLTLAIKAYQEALRVLTFEKFPQDYAKTKMNIGVAYKSLSEVRDKEANLGLAIKACQEALKIFNRESFPLYFIKASYTLAKALSSAGDFKKAIKVMDDMLPAAEMIDHPKLEQYRQFYASLKLSK